MLNEKEEILTYLTTTDEISIKDLASITGWEVSKVYQICCICIREYRIPAKIEGGVNGKYVNFNLLASRGSNQILRTPVPPQTGPVYNVQQATFVKKLEGGSVVTAKEYVEMGRITTIQRIERIEYAIPPEMLDTLKKSIDHYNSSEDERIQILDNIDKLEDDKRILRRIRRRNVEEDRQFQDILNKLEELNVRLESHDKNVDTKLQELFGNIQSAASKTIDTITTELRNQNAQLVSEVVTGNKKLFELIEASSIALEAKLVVQEKQLEEISKKMDLSDEHLQTILGVLDSQPEALRSSIRDKIISVLKKSGAVIAENQEEIEKLLSDIFNKNEKASGRLGAIKNFFSKVKNWIKRHPEAVTALRTLLTGTLTALGVPLPTLK